MQKKAMWRRRLLEAGACSLAAAAVLPEMASAQSPTGLSPQSEHYNTTAPERTGSATRGDAIVKHQKRL